MAQKMSELERFKEDAQLEEEAIEALMNHERLQASSPDNDEPIYRTGRQSVDLFSSNNDDEDIDLLQCGQRLTEDFIDSVDFQSPKRLCRETSAYVVEILESQEEARSTETNMLDEAMVILDSQEQEENSIITIDSDVELDETQDSIINDSNVFGTTIGLLSPPSGCSTLVNEIIIDEEDEKTVYTQPQQSRNLNEMVARRNGEVIIQSCQTQFSESENHSLLMEIAPLFARFIELYTNSN